MSRAGAVFCLLPIPNLFPALSLGVHLQCAWCGGEAAGWGVCVRQGHWPRTACAEVCRGGTKGPGCSQPPPACPPARLPAELHGHAAERHGPDGARDQVQASASLGQSGETDVCNYYSFGHHAEIVVACARLLFKGRTWWGLRVLGLRRSGESGWGWTLQWCQLLFPAGIDPGAEMRGVRRSIFRVMVDQLEKFNLNGATKWTATSHCQDFANESNEGTKQQCQWPFQETADH